MFLLTHAGFRLLWELSLENVSVCTLAHARVCDMTSRNYRAPVDQIYPQILGKPVWISHGLGEYCFVFFFLLVQPLPLCVCESPSAGKVWGIIYLEFQVRAPWRGPRAPTEKWGGRWLCDPADFLSSLLHFTHLFSAGFIFPHRHSLISILHFLLTHFYRRPGDVVLTNAPLRRNPRLTLNEATEAKKHELAPARFYFGRNMNQVGIAAWVCWNDPVLPFQKEDYTESMQQFVLWHGGCFELTWLRSWGRINQCHLSNCQVKLPL